jgi:GAF domain-containing protein
VAQDLPVMQLMYKLAHTVSSSLDVDETLQAVLQSIQEALDVRAVVVRLLNADGTAFEIAAHIGISQEFLNRVSARITPGSVHEHMLNGKSIHVEDLAGADPHGPARACHPHSDEELKAENVGGFVAVPLRVRGRTFGALNVYCETGCGFNQAAIDLLHSAADLSALAIENSRLHTALFRIAQALTSTLELQPLLKQVLASTVMEMGLKAASVRLVDRSGKKLELVAAHGLSDRYLHKGTVILSRSPIDQRVLAGETVLLYDVAGEEGFQYPTEAALEGIRSVLATPLIVKEKVVGVMRVYSAQPRHFTTVGTRFLQSAAGLVAVAIENARLYEALQARYEGLKTDVSEWYRFLSLG